MSSENSVVNPFFKDDDKQNPNFAIPSYYLRELLSKVEESS